MNSKKLLLTFTTLIALGTACSLQGNPATNDNLPEDTAGNLSTPTSTATQTTVTDTQTPEEEEATGELPPISFVEVLEAGIEAGIWTEEEGLVRMMKYLIGEIAAEEIPGISRVEEPEGTGIVWMVNDYLDQPDHDPEIGVELERLLRIMFPPLEVLEEISRPQGAIPTNQLVSTKLIPPKQDQDACEDLAQAGYDPDELENADEIEGNPFAQFFSDCYVYVERMLDNLTFRVYYPARWEGDEEREARVQLTLDALAQAANVYINLPGLSVKDIYVAFGLAPYEEAKGFANNFDTESEACPIAMLPLSDQYNADQYQQAVAHEVFHCVQSWSFPNTKPYDTHKWWMEGSAEYFSNLVHPSANLEYRKLEFLDTRATDLSIFQMTYENFAFFQFMGNKYSTGSLIGILNSISSANGHAGQEDALRAVADFKENFNLYVVELLSSGILDSNQQDRIKTASPPKVTDTKTVEDKDDDPEFRVQPFTAMRFRVDYKQEKRFLQNALTPDAAQFSSVKQDLHQDIGSWSDLPPEIRSECEKDIRYLFAITSVDDFYVDYEIDVTLDEKAECDPCLLGTWDVDPESYAAFMKRVMEQAQTGMTIDLKFGGHQYLQFETDGKIRSQREDFSITINNQITTILNGHGSGTYSADGEEMTVNSFVDVTESVALSTAAGQVTYTPESASYSIFGMDFTDPNTKINLNEGSTPQTRTVEYVCRQDTMTITMPEFGDLDFNRVDKILPTPVPTAAPPDSEQP